MQSTTPSGRYAIHLSAISLQKPSRSIHVLYNTWYVARFVPHKNAYVTGHGARGTGRHPPPVIYNTYLVRASLLGPQSRFGGQTSLKFELLCPQDGTAVLNRNRTNRQGEKELSGQARKRSRAKTTAVIYLVPGTALYQVPGTRKSIYRNYATKERWKPCGALSPSDTAS